MPLTPFRLTRRDLRLASGLILFAYVAIHLTNHALGLISLSAAERGLGIAVAVWHSIPGTVLLYGAAGVHITLAFLALYERRTLRMPPVEALRIALGLWMPMLLIAHAVMTRLAFEAYGIQSDYGRVVWTLWNSNRESRQMALLVPGWLHGCLGLNFAFGRRIWFQRFRLILFGAALLLPVLAVLGFLAMVKEVSLLAQDAAWVNATISSSHAVHRDGLVRLADGLLAMYLAAIGAVLVARLLRHGVESRGGKLVSITYPGRTVRVPRGWTILEASRSHHIPHLSMCGGRARCSTCRVRVVSGLDQCPPAAPDELNTLNRIHAPKDTRLACQLRPQVDVTVVPLLAAETPSPLRKPPTEALEREIAVMVVSFRWSSAPHRLLPQDLLYVLNRYSETVGDMVRTEGGVPNQFSGDQVMVLFGLEVGPELASRQALTAATHLDLSLLTLRDQLAQELGCTAEFVIDLHAGLASIGETGDHAMRTLMAVGNTIDVARQLAAQHKHEEISRVVVSEPVMIAAGLDTRTATWREVVLPNSVRLRVTSIERSGQLGATRPSGDSRVDVHDPK